MLHSEIFRAYDIRGIVDETLTSEAVFAIGRAVGTMVQALGGSTVIIGRDGRLSGPRLAAQLAAGIQASACNVLDIGEVATPVLYFAAKHLGIGSAIMLTGSHNPANYNGLKIILADKTIYGAEIQDLYQIILQEQYAVGAGTYQTSSVLSEYITAVKSNVELARPLKIVVDCGNGIAGAIAPDLYSALGCELIDLHCKVDGNFPNHHPDPSEPHNLQDLIQAVRFNQADLGLAFDGDGDRLGIVDNTGKIIWPDRWVMLLVRELLARKPGATIIYDVKCSRDLADVIMQAGGQALMWNTGHSLIKAKMRETNAELAAEMSGHVFFKDRWYGFDDALYTGARLLEILALSDQSAAQLFAELPERVSTPELSLSVPEQEKFTIMQNLIAQAEFTGAKNKITIDGLRVEFAHGWGLVRPSNTTPKLVLRFEAVSQDLLEEIKQQFRAAIAAIAPQLALTF